MTDQLRKQTLLQAVRAGAAELLHHKPATDDVIAKHGPVDVVTSADLASEQAIVRIIQQYFPGDVIVSEEMSKAASTLTADTVNSFVGWVADPLDGTNSFRFGEHYSSVSLAYIENGQPVMGAVFDPFSNELFFAEYGHGATLNDQSIQVSDTSLLTQLTKVATSNCYENTDMRANLERLLRLSPIPWVYIRGSVTLAMCEVASGRLDLFHYQGLKPWDNAAAFLILAEAGAKVVNLKGQQVTFLSSDIVVGNAALVEAFVAKLHAKA